MNKLVSIITPSYNSEKYISDTINSVLKQNYENWEMIIVDDCSSDNSIAVISMFISKDKRIKLIRLKENSGAAIARNSALEVAKGRFIAFLDSDDIWVYNKLSIQINFMLSKKVAISFTGYSIIDENGTFQNNIIKSVEKINLNGYLKNTIIGFSSSMIDKKYIPIFSFLNIRTRQDTHLWITLLKRHSAFGINNILMNYRVRNDSISSSKIKAAVQVWRLYYKIEKMGFLKSIYYFSYYAKNAVKKRFITNNYEDESNKNRLL